MLTQRTKLGLATALASVFLLGASEVAPQKIILDHADTLRSRGESRELIGHVKVTRGATVITSERAIYSPTEGKITLTGKVHLTDPDRRVDSREVHYNERSGDFEAIGDVDMTAGDSMRIHCERALYTDHNKTAELFDHVVIDIIRDGSHITGGYGLFLTKDSSGTIEESPVYRLPDKPDSLGVARDTLVIISQKIQFSRREHSVLFTGDVRLTRGDVLAVADTLFHYPDSNITRMSGAPLIWRGKDELSGRNVDLSYSGKELRSIIVTGKAVALSPAQEGDSLRNRLQGDKLTVTTPDDSTRVVVVVGDAVGWYRVFDSKEGYQGVNVAAADRIELIVVHDKTTNIKLEGKTSGAFYPPGSEPPEVSEPSPRKTDGIGWGEL